MKSLQKVAWLLLVSALVASAAAQVSAQECVHTIRIGSLAPQGSEWFKAIQATGREVQEKTGGQVCFKLYGGGVMGDESAMIKKVRQGQQLDAAVVTSVGLGDIDGQMLVLQLPLTFRSDKELDCVRGKMTPRFEGILKEEGFALLGWGDVGFNYLFSNTPIASPADAKASKFWVWDADPVVKEVAKVAGVNATPLGVPDVLPSLSTGVIDTFLNSPYGAIALQWHTKAKYVTDLKLAVTIGGTVISQSTLDKLSPEHQKILREVSQARHKDLLTKIRHSNDAAQKQLVAKHGYTAVAVKDINAWLTVSQQVKTNLTGKLFPADLVQEMESNLKTCK